MQDIFYSYREDSASEDFDFESQKLMKYFMCQESIILSITAAGLAQSVEHLMSAEREVAGSMPGAGPILKVLK